MLTELKRTGGEAEAAFADMVAAARRYRTAVALSPEENGGGPADLEYEADFARHEMDELRRQVHGGELRRVVEALIEKQPEALHIACDAVRELLEDGE